MQVNAQEAPESYSLSDSAKAMLDAQNAILPDLDAKLGLATLSSDQLADEELWQRAEGTIVELIESLESSGALPAGVDQNALVKGALHEALGLGPLDDLLADDTVDAIFVDGLACMSAVRAGVRSGTDVGFSSEDVFRRVVARLAAQSGIAVDASSAIVNARLADGSWLSAVLPPVSSRGACMSIRKESRQQVDLASLQKNGVLDEKMAEFLGVCLLARKNIAVCGAPSSGKNAILGALGAAACAQDRIVAIEDVSSLSMARENWIALQTRPARSGQAEVGIAELVDSAFRLNPDRLVVPDVHDGTTLRLLEAMLASFDGSMLSVSSEGSLGALERLVALSGLACTSEVSARRALVSSAVDVVLYVVRYGDGKTRIASVDEVAGGEAGLAVQNLFVQDGLGNVRAAGVVPSFYASLQNRGIAADASLFSQ